jgi:hypothetical protein
MSWLTWKWVRLALYTDTFDITAAVNLYRQHVGLKLQCPQIQERFVLLGQR